MREIDKAVCSCGGTVEPAKTTIEECKEYGCWRDSPEQSCCVTALECDKCGARFTLSLETPDMYAASE